MLAGSASQKQDLHASRGLHPRQCVCIPALVLLVRSRPPSRGCQVEGGDIDEVSGPAWTSTRCQVQPGSQVVRIS